MEQPLQLASQIEIEGRKIGSEYPVFVIAEIGVNHNGEIQIAKKLIEQAAGCGVDCVKFQTFRTEEFMADRDMEYEYSVQGKVVRENMFGMFKRLEMPASWHEELFDYSRKMGLIPLTSVADQESADLVDKLNISAFKLSSEDLINLPLIEHVAKKQKPLIFSTGMADEDEVIDVVKILKDAQETRAVFLHCVSLYPTPEDEVNLLRMKTLAKITGGLVGFSDHTLGIEAVSGAIALGACVIEKHFTLDKKMTGPDHAFSADPEEMTLLVKIVRKIEKMRGSDELKPSVSEVTIRKKFRRSIVAANVLAPGHIIRRQDLVLKRPGTGLKASMIGKLIGKKLSKPVQQDEQILPSSMQSQIL